MTACLRSKVRASLETLQFIGSLLSVRGLRRFIRESEHSRLTLVTSLSKKSSHGGRDSGRGFPPEGRDNFGEKRLDRIASRLHDPAGGTGWGGVC